MSEPRPRAGSWWDRWWFAACATALIVGSDYKFRTRDPSQAVSAAIDGAVILELGVYAMVGLVVARRYGKMPRVTRVPAHVFLACFLTGLMVLSILYATYVDYAFVRSGQMLVLTGLMLLAASSATREHVHRFLHLFIALVSVSIVYGVVRPSTPINRIQENRFTWLAIHPTVAGVITGLGFVVAATYLTWGPRQRPAPHWPLPLYLGITALTGWAMLAVHTRGAILGAAAAYGVVLMLLVGRHGRIQIVAAGVLGTVVVGLTASGRVLRYFERGDSAEQLASLNSRTDLWAVAIDAIQARPMFGYGVGSTRGLFYADSGLGGGHNALINVATDLGLVGAACWLALIAVVVRTAAAGGRAGGAPFTFDRALLVGIVTFLLIDGLFYEGLGGAANVAITTFFVCIAWTSTLGRGLADGDGVASVGPAARTIVGRR